MERYIALLRAVNVSGKNLVKMADLKAKLEENDFKSVKTYIQSGNIIFESPLQKNSVQKRIEKILEIDFNIAIHVVIKTLTELESILQSIPFSITLPGNNMYIMFLKQSIPEGSVEKLKSAYNDLEEFSIKEEIIYFYLPNGMSNAKLSNNFLESKLNVIGTCRNRNTLEKIMELSSH